MCIYIADGSTLCVYGKSVPGLVLSTLLIAITQIDFDHQNIRDTNPEDTHQHTENKDKSKHNGTIRRRDSHHAGGSRRSQAALDAVWHR